MDVKEAFGESLREARQRAGISQEKLAHQCGLDRTTLSLLERGKQQPTLGTILLLADHLGIRASTLVARVEDKIGES